MSKLEHSGMNLPSGSAARAFSAKGFPIIHPQDPGQTVAPEAAAEETPNHLFTRHQMLHQQHVAAKQIAQGQRQAAGAIAGVKVTFEIDRPDGIAAAGAGQLWPREPRAGGLAPVG